MTNTIGHGHVYPRDDGYKANCGGPGFCCICNAESVGAGGTAREDPGARGGFGGGVVSLTPGAVIQQPKGSSLDWFISDVEDAMRGGFRTSEEMAGESLPDPAEAATAAERARCIAMVQQALKEWPWAPSEGTKRFAANVVELINKGEA